jgi:hypothetical protein
MKTPYLDKAPNYERDYKTGKYIITNNYKNAEQNSDDAQKQFYQECGVQIIENYINFTNPPQFKINPDYPYENDLASTALMSTN